MPKKDPNKILQDVDELKSDMKIARKMFKDAYLEELKRLKQIERLSKSGLKSKEPITEGDLALVLVGTYRELQRVLTNTHMGNLSYISTSKRIAEVNIALNAIVSVLGDFAQESGLQSAQKNNQKTIFHIIN